MVSGVSSPKPRPPASAKRWFQEKTSSYPHEQEALDHVAGLMPKNEPFRAWASFSFTARSGRVNECDLFLVTPGGLHLVEFKAHPGRVTNNGRTWRFHAPHKTFTITNPLHLTDLKSKELKGQLQWAARELGLGASLQIPRIEPSVFLTDPNLVSELDDVQRVRVFGRNPGSGLDTFTDGVLLKPPQGAPVSARLSQHLPRLLKKIGISQSQRHLRFGDEWELEPELLDAGPTWEDRLARKSGLVSEQGRVRIYLVNLQATDEDRSSVNRAALREYQVLQGITHRGIAQAIDIREHMGGPAILFRHRADDLRLDAYLDVHGASLSPETRLDLVRQLAEGIRYAHNRSLYHRALSARSVFVTAKPDGSDPVLRIIDWQTAARDFDTSTGRTLGNSPAVGDHLEDSAQLYLAPEFDGLYPDPIELDVFGLGAVSYLILTGQPPAIDRATLIDRLESEQGLHPYAVAGGLSTDIDDLVFQATRGEVGERLESADRFLELLDQAALSVEESADTWTGVDPLTAEPGTAIDGDASGVWTVERILGTGSTGKAFLVTRTVEDPDGGGSVPERRVFKVALNEDLAAEQLRKEAHVLEQVGGGAIIRLLAGPRELNGRTVLDLEYAGDRSLRTWLNTEGKLTYHQLHQFGADLFKALDQLAARGLRHRDIKPENLGIFQRADRGRELRLFDFSHSSVSDRDVRSGTRGYMDPFIGTTRRPAFDDHAERYAAAVTLHEMATKEKPVWNDGQTDPRTTKDQLYPKLSADLFEPALRDGLTAFFRRAMHREVSERFDTFRLMDEAWREIFRSADATAPPGAQSDETLEEQRDSAADAATLETNLRESGLSPRAVSVAEGFNATTVGQLLKVAPHLLARARGSGSTVRRELLRRHKQWTAALLGPAEPGPSAESAGQTLTQAGFDARLRVDELARLLTPAEGRRGSKTPAVIRLTLGLPVDGVEPLGVWPTGRDIAERLDMTPAGVYRAQSKHYELWFEASWLRSVRDDLVALLESSGRVMTAAELAAAFRVRRGGSDGSPEQAFAQAMTVVRAAVLAETWSGAGRPADDEPRFEVSRLRDGRVLVSLESLPGTDDPSPRELVDYAVELGGRADALVALEPLPGKSEVTRALREARVPEGMPALPETRLLSLAASMSFTALASPRLDLYPRDLDLVRALRISQAAAGARPERGITEAALLDRLRAWFPDLAALEPEPTYLELEEALREAGFQFVYDVKSKEFRPPAPTSQWTSTGASLVSYARSSSEGGGPEPLRKPTDRTGANLERAIREGGFVALTVDQRHLPGTAARLGLTHPVVPVDVAEVFLTQMHALAEENNQPWPGLLRADEKYGRVGAIPAGLRSYVSLAWKRTTEAITALADAPRTVLLLHNAGLMARYHAEGGHETLVSLQQAARRPGSLPYGLWLLCPAEAPKAAPNLDGWTVEAIESSEWSVLDRAFLDSLRKA